MTHSVLASLAMCSILIGAAEFCGVEGWRWFALAFLLLTISGLGFQRGRTYALKDFQA